MIFSYFKIVDKYKIVKWWVRKKYIQDANQGWQKDRIPVSFGVLNRTRPVGSLLSQAYLWRHCDSQYYHIYLPNILSID